MQQLGFGHMNRWQSNTLWYTLAAILTQINSPVWVCAIIFSLIQGLDHDLRESWHL